MSDISVFSEESDLFSRFGDQLDRNDIVAFLSSGLLGEGLPIPGGAPSARMIYADYVASGRALEQIETAIMRDVLPYYANSHTEASFCGQRMTRLRSRSRQIILNECGGDDRHAVVFTGAGSTAGLNRLVNLLDIKQRAERGERPLVLIGPYEHHSNILPWRESGAEVIELDEAVHGGPDLEDLERVLLQEKGRFIVGAFSAASNVTGIVSDVAAITKLLNAHGAVSLWDYAGGGPYLPINMQPDGAQIDAVVVSTHKFIGGPAASGVMVVRRDTFARAKPTAPGGGTVRFVSPWGHDYAEDIEHLEESGTPNVVGDLRAGLVFMVKAAIGAQRTADRLGAMRQRALTRWQAIANLEILGNPDADQALPIFSFRVRDGQGGYVHQQLITRMLSDRFGIQARGGCACAGPYAHRLLDIDANTSQVMRDAILSGREIEKPGWTRLGFSVLMSDEKVERIIDAVAQVAEDAVDHAEAYRVDESTARFTLEVA